MICRGLFERHTDVVSIITNGVKDYTNRDVLQLTINSRRWMPRLYVRRGHYDLFEAEDVNGNDVTYESVGIPFSHAFNGSLHETWYNTWHEASS